MCPIVPGTVWNIREQIFLRAFCVLCCLVPSSWLALQVIKFLQHREIVVFQTLILNIRLS